MSYITLLLISVSCYICFPERSTANGLWPMHLFQLGTTIDSKNVFDGDNIFVQSE